MAAPMPNTDPVDIVLAALEPYGVRRSGNAWTARCPAHDDSTPSLSIKRGDNVGAVLFCHAGCATIAVVDALGLTLADIGNPDRARDQWRVGGTPVAPPRTVDEQPRTSTPKPKLGNPVARYIYRDADGTELFSKLRYEPKTFRVKNADGSWGIGDANPVLYRLPEVKAAIAEGRAILLVEGEKDADRATTEHGLVATCNYEGAAKPGQTAKWRPEYTEQLRGAKVIIVADNDDPGYAHARAAADALTGVADQVAIFRPNIDQPKADLSDHFDAGHGIEQLIRVPHGPNGDEQAAPIQKKPDPLPTLPASFWEARPVLTHIQQAAHARGRSADLVFGAIIARISGMVSHELTFDTGMGVGSLNMFVAAVGPSGLGKSTGADAAQEVIPVPRYLDPHDGSAPFRDGLPIGSGEGLCEAYMGTANREIPGECKQNGDPKTEKVRTQVRHNAFVYVDEGESLMRMTERSGSTIGPTIRSAWSGQLLGQANAREETTRLLPARSYALGLLIGFQRHTCQPLLADATAGTPQRFLWFSAIDATIPDTQPRHPGQLRLPIEDGFTPVTGTIEFADEIRNELWQRNLARVRGEIEGVELDSHQPLMRCKIAALLAIIDGRTHVTTDDWDLALVVWDTSAAVRDSLVTHGKSQAARERWIRDQQQVELATRTAAEVSQVDSKLDRIAKLLVAYVEDEGTMTNTAAKKKLASRDRALYDAAVDRGVAAGTLRAIQGGIALPLTAV